jgi:hypothetical protein
MKNHGLVQVGVWVILGLALAFGRTQCAIGQEARTFFSENEALAAIKASYGVVLGVEASPKSPGLPHGPITLHLPPGDAAKAFDELVAQLPNCIWELRDGVYDLRPKDDTASILDERISLFSVIRASPAEASDAITRLPEVQRWLALRGVTRREIETGAMSLASKSAGKASLSMRNVMLRTVLNNLAKQFPSQQWSVVRYGDQAQYLAVYL